MKITKAFITNLRNDPYMVLNNLSENDIVAIIQKANYDYYNSESPLFSDQLYDLVKEYLEKKNPNHPILKNVGAAIGFDERKEKLPYFMGSLDKIKTDSKVLEKWSDKYKGEYVISDKLDGNSALLYWNNCQLKLFSRGDGKVGQNISHLLHFIKNIPSFAGKDTYAVRGELVISKEDFEKRLSLKGANARNMVAGLINSKVPDLEIASYTQFIAYEVIYPELKPVDQMKMLTKNGYKVVNYDIIKNINIDVLSNFLVERRKESEFEIDGIVVAHNNVYKREDANPDYAFAFKSIHTMEKAEVIVTHVEWNLSKDGYYIPVVNFNDVKLAGVIIKRAHGFNGKFIKDNNIGPGSRIIIMRSGDVIPYITEILSSSETGKPQMPEVDYEWSKSGVDIILSAKDSSNELKLKNIEYFFDKIDIKGVSKATVKKIYDAGFKTIKAILNINKQELLSIPGFKEKTANNILEGLHERIKTLKCNEVMDASNIMGRGIGAKKIELITKAFPAIQEKRYIPTLHELIGIKGVETTTAEQFISNLPAFFKFLDDNDIHCGHEKTPKIDNIDTSKQMEFLGQKIVFTGFRDEDLESYIVKRGGQITSSVSKNTNYVIVKDASKSTSKIEKAVSLGVVVISRDDFVKKYNIVV